MRPIYSLKIFVLISIVALLWSLLTEPVAKYFLTLFEPNHHYLLKTFVDFAIVMPVVILICFLITNHSHKLRTTATDYKRIFEEIPMPMFIYDSATYKFMDVNAAAVKLYGFTREEFMTLTPADVRLQGRLKLFDDKKAPCAGDKVNLAYWLHYDKDRNPFHVCVYTNDTFFKGKPARQALVINIDNRLKGE